MLLRFLTIIFALLSTSAHAWNTHIEGPDVFGNTKVVAAEMGYRSGLVIQCDQKDQLSIAFVERSKEFSEIKPIAAKLLVQASKNPALQLPATLRTWNKDYIGFVSSGKTAENIQAVESLKEARGTIRLGAEVGGQQFSAEVSAQGSTKAIQKIIDGCKLSPGSGTSVPSKPDKPS